MDPIDALTDVRPRSDRSSADADRPVEPGDDDRVLQLLADRGGHAWQGTIPSIMGWSAPKTSRLLTELEDEDRITRYRVGRRKVVCLPQHEPDSLQKWGSHPAQPR